MTEKEEKNNMKKIVILLMLGLVLFSGCSRKDKEESVLFDKMFTEYTEQVNCSGDFGFHASFQVHRENTIFDYSDLVLLLSYGNKTLHMPLFRADPVISSNGTTVQLTSNELKFSEPGSIYFQNTHPREDAEIQVYLYRKDNRIYGYATYVQPLVMQAAKTKEFWTFNYTSLTDLPETMTLKMTGENVSISDVRVIQNQLGFFGVEKDNVLFACILLVAAVVLFVISFVLQENLLPLYADGFPINAGMTCCIAYGIIGLLVQFMPDAGMRITDAVNTIFSSFGSKLFMDEGLFQVVNLVLPYLAIAAGLYLGFLAIDECGNVLHYLVLIFTGVLCLPAVYLLCLILLMLIGFAISGFFHFVAVVLGVIVMFSMIEHVDFSPTKKRVIIKDEYGNETSATITQYGEYGPSYMDDGISTLELKQTGHDNELQDDKGNKYHMK